MFCPICGSVGKFDDFAETDKGKETPFYQCSDEKCGKWFYGEPDNSEVNKMEVNDSHQ